MANLDLDGLLESAKAGITRFLDEGRKEGRIDEGSCAQARRNTFPLLEEWLRDEHYPRISPNLRAGIARAIEAGQWEAIVNAFRQKARFGTGGIRGMMAFDRASIELLATQGIAAPVLKGPNTVNDIVLLSCSTGVAQFGKAQDPPFEKVVIGYDSRIRGFDFARIVAELFLAYDYTVYFFDAPCPYPEMTFAIPYRGIKAELGILISASHNDYRYNGYKLSCGNGSQFDPEQRNEMYNKYIAQATSRDIRLCPFAEAKDDKLVFLGGEAPVAGFDYHGRQARIMNIHREHAAHVRSFLMTPDLDALERQSPRPLKIAYCPFHGAGRRAVPRLLREVGFADENVQIITEGGLNDLNGFFPSFSSEPGREQQPDPGDPRSAKTAVEAFKRQVARQRGPWGFDELDILVGTDPDADRCGVVAKVPPEQQHLFGQDWLLLPADMLWALLLWYRLHREAEANGGRVPDADKKFVVLSHTTSDAITLLARKHGLGVVRTWVGFAALAAAVRDVWEKKPVPALVEGRTDPAALCHPFVCQYIDVATGQRSINLGAFEQSNGFSLLGGPPPDRRSLGVGGHVRDKDGVLAALLVAEIAAWAKQRGTTLFQLIDEQINRDPQIGLFVTAYEPDPLDGEYPGIQGDRKKKEILRRALGYFQLAMAGDLEIAGKPVRSAAIYRTGKYDAIYEPTYDYQFPDEGVRFYFEDQWNHLTIRPSGTGNSLRFHIQLHTFDVATDLVAKKQALLQQAQELMNELRRLLRAPRNTPPVG